LLLAICAITAFLTIVNVAGQTGLAGRTPWFGVWGATFGASARPLTLAVLTVESGGPSDDAGLRPGDLIDIRENSLVERFSIEGQPLAGRPIVLSVLRANEPLRVTVVPRPINFAKRWDVLVSHVATLLIVTFAGIIAMRRAHVREMRLLALSLAFYASGFATKQSWYAAPWAWVYLCYSCYGLVWPISIALWASYASSFSLPLSRLRAFAQQLCFVFVGIAIVIRLLAIIGTVTLWLRPVMLDSSVLASVPLDLAIFAALGCSVLAIAASRDVDRQRAIWSIVPLAVLIGIVQLTHLFDTIATSYSEFLFWSTIGNVTIVLAPLALTYAALNRRLIDIGFVLNRALIFGIISIVVVGVFLIVEWAFNEWFVETNHITGNLASMAVALALGFSIHIIHGYVDRFVDRVFFRRRHEDLAALRRFSQEASYITDRAVLLQRTVHEIKEHTQATDVQIFLSRDDHMFAPAASTEGGSPRAPVDENDEAVVGMRTWHKPVDVAALHESALTGDFAFPLTVRTVLAGFILCGAKSDGEIYEPDESDAILAISQAVAGSLGSLDSDELHSTSEILKEIALLREQIRLLTIGPGGPQTTPISPAGAARP
jgi:hypothetical protein